MQQIGYWNNFQITEDFFKDERKKQACSASPRQMEENKQIFDLQTQIDAEKRPIDAGVKESQLIALQEEIMVLKDRLALAEAENNIIRSSVVRTKKDKSAFCVQCAGCKNRLCQASDVLKMIDDEDLCNARQGEEEGQWCLSTGCYKDNVIVGSAKDALIFTEVFYASSVFCNTCLIEVGYCLRQNTKSSIFQTIVNGLYIFKRVQIQNEN